MENKLEVFKNEEFGEVRTIEENGKTFFMASDIARSLGYTRPNDAIAAHCRATVKRSTPISGKLQEVNFITEGDVYRLISKSQLPAAEKFETWVFDEVIPSIRRHGLYATEELLDNPDLLIKVATALKEEREARKILEKENQLLITDNEVMKPKADYFDDLVDRNLLTNIRNTAKELGMKEKDFIKFLMNQGYIYREQGGAIRPYADKNKGLFQLKEYSSRFSEHAGVQTLITPRGRETFRLLIK